MITDHIRVSTPQHAETCPQPCGGVHSYTAEGARWCWTSAQAGRHAIDVELIGPIPELLRRKFDHPEAEFWQAWTALEVIAKLTQTPILTLVGQGKLGEPAPPNISLTHFERGDVIGCLGEFVVTTPGGPQ